MARSLALHVLVVLALAPGADSQQGGQAERQAAAAVLGVSPLAKPADVAAAFRRRSFELHPEAGGIRSDESSGGQRYDDLCEGALLLGTPPPPPSGACPGDVDARALAVTPLLLAAQRGDTAAALSAMEAPCFGPAVLAQGDVFGLTPLHWAARQGWAHLAEVLLSAGAPVESRTSSVAYGGSEGGFFTPLMVAAARNHAHVVEVLLQHGALVGPTAADGATDAMALACRAAHKATVGVLLDHAVVPVPADCTLPPKRPGELGTLASLREMRRRDASMPLADGEEDTWDLAAFERFLSIQPHLQATPYPERLFRTLDVDGSGVLDAAEFRSLSRYLARET